MTADEIDAPAKMVEPPTVLQRYYEVHPTYRLILRWALMVTLTAVAFHRSIASLVEVTRNDSIGGYVWTVPTAAVLVASAIARRNRTELPIHDRQTDIIVGIIGLGLALLIQGVLLPRYALYFYLLRLDLVAMWLFVVASAVVLFGLRPVIRFSWVWAMLLLVFSLPYYLAVISLGGGKVAAGAATLLIAGLGAGIAGGPSYRRGALASAAAWAVGFAILAVVAIFLPTVPMRVYQQIPALSAICVVGLAMFFLSRRGKPKRVLERKVEPLAAKQVWAGVPLVTAAALVLATFPLPISPNAAIFERPSGYPLVSGTPPVAPPGWMTSAAITRTPVNRLYGPDAVLVRQRMTADVGNPRWDKMGSPRTVVVDSTVSQRPFSLGTYPSRVLYGLTSARISEIREVDLGMGVIGSLISVVDDQLLVTWNSMQFNWGDEDLAQRVTIFAVDNHDPDAPFPQPTQNLFPTLRTLITLLFRGNEVLDQRTPSFKDADMLSQFGRALVAAQSGPAP
ncbi:Uncharacterised protein [Mycolicibacterium vanbaalenii]|uniref:Transmembrane protein n=1 Tax=Mycolicibacterium vanbaalenii TaxID=110539 RepID=A0A5S9QID1_MYCVN|nr:hypothetical protein [Mycolicibacterium vanbaalenii]CAA0117286.1 Uncharacterised protein [Mycolicibacterium vanbaalenii]